jgi:hypothetical protein
MRSTLSMVHALRDLEDARMSTPDVVVLAMLLACREGEGENVRHGLRGASAPAVIQLARMTKLGESTVRRVLGRLRTFGYLTVRCDGHHHAATVYDVVLPERSHAETSRSETSRSETSLTERETSRCEQSDLPQRAPDLSQRALLRISLADHLADPSADTDTSPSAPVPADAVTTMEPLALAIDEETTSKRPSKGKSETSAVTRHVFDAYLAGWRKHVGVGVEPQLTTARQTQIQARLRRYSVERLTRAFEGLFASPFHCGDNDAGTKYLGIEQVIRADERVETFEGKPASGTTTIRRSRNGPIRQAPVPNAPWRREGL